MLTVSGLLAETFLVPVQDVKRIEVVRVLSWPVQDVQEVFDKVSLSLDTDAVELIAGLFARLGMSLDTVSHGKILQTFAYFVAKATMAFSCSYTSEGSIDSGCVVQGLRLGFGEVRFYRQELACLNEYMGAPLWTFGYAATQDVSWLSVSVQHFADLWGPLFTCPLPGPLVHGHELPETIVHALRTEGGLLYRSPNRRSSMTKDPTPENNETLIHWAPVHQSELMIKIKGSKGQSFHFEPFDVTNVLLIGQPTSTSTSTPNTRTEPVSTHIRPALMHNNSCAFQPTAFAAHHCHRFHLCGTSNAFYEPAEFQLGLQGGQYIVPTAAMVWKNRAGTTYKKRLLFYLENPCTDPETVKNLLRRLTGFQMSACTWHSRRITLADGLTLAFPSEARNISEACSTGDASRIVHLVSDLALSGFDPRGSFLLYWNYGRGGQVFEMKKDRPRWSDMLKDARDSACFAVLAPDCLVLDSLSCRHGFDITKTEPVFQTRLGLNKYLHEQLALRTNTQVKIANGSLRLALGGEGKTNISSNPTHTDDHIHAVYDRALLHFSNFRLSAEEQCAQEIMDSDKPTTHVLPVSIVDLPTKIRRM